MARTLKKQPKNEGARIKSREVNDISPEQQRPLFSLRFLEKDFCITCCEQQEKAAFADTLHRLSQLSWNQLKQAPRHGLGYEKIGRQHINAPIPAHIKEDVNFIAFRFYGNAPMVGFREMATFHIVWLDRQFKLYDHE
jgi:hypothetical protein